MQWHLQ